MKKGTVVPINDSEFNVVEEEVEQKVAKFYTGWKNFAFKKDIINVAIGMIIATSFKHVVNSLVNDIIMPILIGLGAGKSVENLFVVLVPGKDNNVTYHTLEQAKESGAVTLNYGNFITIFLNLIFISLFLYIIMRCIVKIKKEIKNEFEN